MPELKNDHGKTLVAWKFPEYSEHKRGRTWHVFFFFIGAILVLSAILTYNWLFLFIVLIAWATIFLTTRRRPLILKFGITEDGLEIEKKFYPYEDINNFWIIYNPPESKYLYFNLKGFYKPDLVIPIDRTNPIKVRQALLRYLKEDITKEDESLSEVLNRYYKI